MFDKLCLHLQKDVFYLKKYLTMLKYVQIHIYSESIFSVQNILDHLGNFSKAQSKFISEKQIQTELKKQTFHGTIIRRSVACPTFLRNGRTDYTMCFTWYNLSDHFYKHNGWFAQSLSKMWTFLALAKSFHIMERSFNFISFGFETSLL